MKKIKTHFLWSLRVAAHTQTHTHTYIVHYSLWLNIEAASNERFMFQMNRMLNTLSMLDIVSELFAVPTRIHSGVGVPSRQRRRTNVVLMLAYHHKWTTDHLPIRAFEAIYIDLNPCRQKRRTNLVLMLAHRLWRWPNIKTTLVQRLMSVGFLFLNYRTISATCKWSLIYSFVQS